MSKLYDLALRLMPPSPYAGRSNWGAFQTLDISTEGSLYLRRFVLVKTPWGGLYLHHIVRSDRDRCTHDHPWPFWSLILWGGYNEEMPVVFTVMTQDGQRIQEPQTERMVSVWRKPGSLRYCPAEHLHRVSLPHRRPDGTERPCWSLVLVGPRVRSWGFWGRHGWTPWREFVDGPREC